MYEPSPQLRTEISSLQWLNEKQLKDQYAALIPDAMSCPREDLLRSLIAYRLQEKFYGIRLSDATKKMLQKTIEETRFFLLLQGVLLPPSIRLREIGKA